MDEPKNIKDLLSSLPDLELPAGYDQRFLARLSDRQKNILQRFGAWVAPYSWATALAGIMVGIFFVRNQRQDESAFAVQEEIDMLENLDLLLDWEEEKET